MKCSICKTGATAPGKADVVLQRAGATIVLKGVPADVCDNCGEYYLAQDVAARTYALADTAVNQGAEVEIMRFAA
ncbi:MAG: hypothetical protein CMN28_14650 [Salinisphaeraceae bacterium]|jgi:YgiT-type zinc finger domain-containing protein|nr:hypothetical protein [Salinisphaeraceae bacterium]